MEKIIGWGAVVVAILSLIPSFIPGVISVIGLVASLGALIVSVFSVNSGRQYHFYSTLTIVVLGVFFINDALRIWEPLPVPINAKIAMYAITSCIVIACLYYANRLSNHTL